MAEQEHSGEVRARQLADEMLKNVIGGYGG